MRLALLNLLAATLAFVSTKSLVCAAATSTIAAGQLVAIDHGGKLAGNCPLQHTAVKAEISGFVARVEVTQRFTNTFADKIEAIYVFPLPHDSAVDRMVMRVGSRTIKGLIKERQEARQMFEAARKAGHLASLLDQQRPNIFHQTVANIAPGETVEIVLTYSNLLEWQAGEFKFVFPTVVGPRYIPGRTLPSERLDAVEPVSAQVPDAERITPPLVVPGAHAAHDLSMMVELLAGAPIRSISSPLHKIQIEYLNVEKSEARIKLETPHEFADRDFVLTYRTAGDEIADTTLAHTDERGKFVTLVLQPPRRTLPESVLKRELIFVIDKSGSMSGMPIETAKAAMKLCIEQLRDEDTFNLMTFEGGVGFCFARPVANTAANRTAALAYLAALQGDGGTKMLPAIRACLGGQDDRERMRVVCFMTDGYVGNDFAIIDAVKQHAGVARVFAFGIGRSVNQFLLDGIANAGRGEVEYVLNESQAVGAAERFAERIRNPILSDIRISSDGVPIERWFPAQIPDLFSVKPLVVHARYAKAGSGHIIIEGQTAQGPFRRAVAVTLPDAEPDNAALASLWARANVTELMRRDMDGLQRGKFPDELRQQIVDLGLKYQLLTQFTSFVAVEERPATPGDARTMKVPVEVPQGMIHPELQQANAVFSEAGGGIALGAMGSGGGNGGFGQGFGGRGTGARKGMLGAYGGTNGTERSVAAGLNWLARHQQPDGSWCFEPVQQIDKEEPKQIETKSDKLGATGLALLTFLGAGQTTGSKGPYRQTIRRAFADLMSRMPTVREADKRLSNEADLRWHAMAALALCENYGQTNDKSFGVAAQSALDVIAGRQQKNGGWGSPRTTGWQILAIQSGRNAGLSVDERVLERASKFLDNLQTENGEPHGNHQPDKEPVATAAAIFCRRLLNLTKGWTPPKASIEFLAGIEPSLTDCEHTYFLTLAARGSGSDPTWDTWMRKTRRSLVAAQASAGDDAGSWPSDAASTATRLENTALNLCTLEVFYRYLSLYKP